MLCEHVTSIDAERLIDALGGNMTIYARRSDRSLKKIDIGSYLRGENLPNAETMRSICIQTGVSADWLLGLSDERSTGEMAERSLPRTYERIRSLDPYAKDVDIASLMWPNAKSPSSRLFDIKKRSTNGTHGEIRLRTLLRAKDAYGCSIDWLLGIGRSASNG